MVAAPADFGAWLLADDYRNLPALWTGENMIGFCARRDC